MNKKQTAVEFLKQEYIKRGDCLPSGVFEDAKEMHKQEIIKTVLDVGSFMSREEAEQYYQQTFKKD